MTLDINSLTFFRWPFTILYLFYISADRTPLEHEKRAINITSAPGGSSSCCTSAIVIEKPASRVIPASKISDNCQSACSVNHFSNSNKLSPTTTSSYTINYTKTGSCDGIRPAIVDNHNSSSHCVDSQKTKLLNKNDEHFATVQSSSKNSSAKFNAQKLLLSEIRDQNPDRDKSARTHLDDIYSDWSFSSEEELSSMSYLVEQRQLVPKMLK